MKGIFRAILIIVLVVLFGTWPLSILSKLFDVLATITGWLAGVLNLFGWNGIV